MPLIRCPECGQAYNVPPSLAVRLPTSVANCSCGHWLCGSREGLLSKLSESGRIDEIDLTTYRVDLPPAERTAEPIAPFEGPQIPRHLRVIARAAEASINRVFTIDENPLWIGRKGCHIDLGDDAELSIQHCSIASRNGQLVITDADSHTGTFLDGQQITEATVEGGTHLLRIGSTLVCIEPVDFGGEHVGPLRLVSDELFDVPSKLRKKQAKESAGATGKLVLHCIEGTANGMEFDIPTTGATVGREGTIKVPDDYLSRKHFSLRFDEGGALRIKDLGSRNGTYLNTLPARNTKVVPGDEIRAGLSLFRVERR